ncbi:GyrI-like domain-containing protein [Cohnella soli]|uniref:GyrI-like domain-containing protein n=1 Tax=Cohnella soli TaxID=425005 RepID=A0ABW0HQ35_9BACL
MSVNPQFVRKKSFYLVGEDRYTANGISDIREAWDALHRRLEEIRSRVPSGALLGFEDYSRETQMKPGQFPEFHYIAAAEVERIEDVPGGMYAKEVPEATYAVFSYRGPISSLSGMFRYIYDEWFPSSGYKLDPKVQADFEYYTEQITDWSNASIEIYIPVVTLTGE